MCGRCSTRCGDSKHKIWPETLTEKCYFEALELDRTIVKKLILKKPEYEDVIQVAQDRVRWRFFFCVNTVTYFWVTEKTDSFLIGLAIISY